ncbi:hypothetical protein ACSCBZ_42580 [Streptomyces niveiscabiei]|uniref:hypothetical protein n=1 Tax=Streptomyces niveiscabiei TaxID=164115 RepID=UPI0006EB6470|nr:hypothetical protein [Streptomyces niveiscabiei]
MISELPHDPYMEAVVEALAAAGIEPDARTSDAEIDRHDDGPDAGCTRVLDAFLVWDACTPGLNTDSHEYGIALLWEHSADQWTWAPLREDGVLEYVPESLPLHRWADPAAVVDVVRVLLAGLPAPAAEDPRLWLHYVSASEAVAAWSTEA